jgi:uncharacterized membrane protein
MLEYLLLVAQKMPSLFGSYDLVMLVSRILHILGAIIMVGGLFYLWAVITPDSAASAAGREGVGEGSSADQYFGGRRAAWAKWVGIASLLLLVTGLWNFVNMVKLNHLHPSYHMLGGLKILLGIALMLVAALLAGRSAAADALRQKWRRWLAISLLLGIIIVGMGSVMRTYPRTPKVEAQPAPTLIAP